MVLDMTDDEDKNEQCNLCGYQDDDSFNYEENEEIPIIRIIIVFIFFALVIIEFKYFK